MPAHTLPFCSFRRKRVASGVFFYMRSAGTVPARRLFRCLQLQVLRKRGVADARDRAATAAFEFPAVSTTAAGEDLAAAATAELGIYGSDGRGTATFFGVVDWVGFWRTVQHH